MWKSKGALPFLNTPRDNHGSCAVEDAIYVVGGTAAGGLYGNKISSIEMLGMRLNFDLSFALLGKTWN